MRIVKVLGISVAAVAVVAVLGIGFGLGWPVLLGARTRPVTGRVFERTPERLQRGEYLANSVMGCLYCHSPFDPAAPGRTPQAGRLGAGAVMLQDAAMLVAAPNITSDRETGIGAWSDDEIARAIREGVDRDGQALFPLMPYVNFRDMDDEDLASVVVYLRSLPAISNRVPARQLPGPLPYLIRNEPKPVTAPVKAPTASAAERGRYLMAMASCEECHTTVDDKRRRLPGMQLAGGNRMTEERGSSVVPNITPDETGIAAWDAQRFRAGVRTGNDGGRQLSPVMPYGAYGGMRDEDVDAIFAYIRTVKPVRHYVSVAANPVRCPQCGHEHGYGEMNTAP